MRKGCLQVFLPGNFGAICGARLQHTICVLQSLSFTCFIPPDPFGSVVATLQCLCLLLVGHRDLPVVGFFPVIESHPEGQ